MYLLKGAPPTSLTMQDVTLETQYEAMAMA